VRSLLSFAFVCLHDPGKGSTLVGNKTNATLGRAGNERAMLWGELVRRGAK
jgi:hypothetical protein